MEVVKQFYSLSGMNCFHYYSMLGKFLSNSLILKESGSISEKIEIDDTTVGHKSKNSFICCEHHSDMNHNSNPNDGQNRKMNIASI